MQNEFPYNISARCINKEWFRLPMEQVWDIFSEELYLVNRYHGLQIYMFILMHNHFHLIASTPEANISQCMHYFMKMTSLRLTRAGNRINETYTGRYYKTILLERNNLLNAYKYNYQNSLVVEGVRRVEDYPYSTLYGLLGKEKLLIPVVEDHILFHSPDETLRWLNSPIDKIKQDALRWALKRQYFRSKLCRNTRKPIVGKYDVV